MSKVRALVSLLALVLVVVAVAGCNTMEGLGKDTKKLGDSLENAAARNK